MVYKSVVLFVMLVNKLPTEMSVMPTILIIIYGNLFQVFQLQGHMLLPQLSSLVVTTYGGFLVVRISDTGAYIAVRSFQHPAGSGQRDPRWKNPAKATALCN